MRNFNPLLISVNNFLSIGHFKFNIINNFLPSFQIQLSHRNPLIKHPVSSSSSFSSGKSKKKPRSRPYSKRAIHVRTFPLETSSSSQEAEASRVVPVLFFTALVLVHQAPPTNFVSPRLQAMYSFLGRKLRNSRSKASIFITNI